MFNLLNGSAVLSQVNAFGIDARSGQHDPVAAAASVWA